MANCRSSYADHVAVCEVETDSTSGRAANTKAPVEPVPLCVTQILAQMDLIFLTSLHQDIPTGEGRVNAKWLCFVHVVLF